MIRIDEVFMPPRTKDSVMASRIEKSGPMVSMFDAARQALLDAGVKVNGTWSKSKVVTLAQAQSQLARKDLQPKTAAKWIKAATLVLAGVHEHPELDPRRTAYRGPRR